MANEWTVIGSLREQPLLKRMAALTDEQIIEWYESVLPILQKLVGAHRSFDPMYPNFPQQVMEASDAELYFNAMTHYYGFFLADLRVSRTAVRRLAPSEQGSERGRPRLVHPPVGREK